MNCLCFYVRVTKSRNNFVYYDRSTMFRNGPMRWKSQEKQDRDRSLVSGKFLSQRFSRESITVPWQVRGATHCLRRVHELVPCGLPVWKQHNFHTTRGTSNTVTSRTVTENSWTHMCCHNRFIAHLSNASRTFGSSRPREWPQPLGPWHRLPPPALAGGPGAVS